MEKVKDLWIRLGLREHYFPVKDMACYGCKPKNKCAYTELRSCARNKMYENCGLCDEYPCNTINRVFDKSEKLKESVKHVCTQEEKDNFQKAFFSKKTYCNTQHLFCRLINKEESYEQ